MHPSIRVPPPKQKVDDAAWTEVRNFQKCLLQMAMASDRDVMFMETAMKLSGGRSHAVMEAIFVDPQVGAALANGEGVFGGALFLQTAGAPDRPVEAHALVEPHGALLPHRSCPRRRCTSSRP